MATRQMVGQRKGPPSTVDDPADGTAPDASDSGDAPDTPNGDSDVVKCPNCDCEFNETTMDVVKPGKPVADGSGYGADLDQSGSALPVPGPEGTAADASRGTQAMGNLLANLRGKV